MLIYIVDEQDNVIGYKERSLLDKGKDIFRVSVLWIINEYDEILLAKRALSKESQAGKWGPAAAGTLEKGESYESNVVKEAKEELGIKVRHLKKYKKNFFKSEEFSYFSIQYVAKLKKSTSFSLQVEEVETVKWVDKQTLLNWIKESPEDFVSSMSSHIVLITQIV
jgi:isopentenyldiphosphate isomerase